MKTLKKIGFGATFFIGGYLAYPLVEISPLIGSYLLNNENNVAQGSGLEGDVSNEFDKRRGGFQIPLNNIEIYQKNGDYLVRGDCNNTSYETGIYTQTNENDSKTIMFFRQID